MAHLYWRPDFADPAKAPDFTTEPLFRYPRNAEAANALRSSADERLADGTLSRAVGDLALPVLVLHGRQDPLPVEGAIELAALLPASDLVVLEDVGHSPWLEDAPEVERALRRFIASVATAS